MRREEEGELMDERGERRRGKRTENKGERRVEDMAWKRERGGIERGRWVVWRYVQQAIGAFGHWVKASGGVGRRCTRGVDVCIPLLPGDEGRRCGLRAQSPKGARRKRVQHAERREGGEREERRNEREER